MSNEILVLFGAFIVLVSLKQKRTKHRMKKKGFTVLAVTIEGFAILVGISTLTIGLIGILS